VIDFAERTDSLSTHQVFNQSPPFSGHNAFTDDPLLQRICRGLSSSIQRELAGLGDWAGQAETLQLGRLANQHGPKLHAFDAKGNRIDRIEFHPSWHELMRVSIERGMHASCWEDGTADAEHRHLARAARFYITAGVEMGHLCPITMTNASVAALQKSPNIAEHWLPKITNRDYDPREIPAAEKRQVTLGMGMTEKQGGTDVRANTTRAEPVGHGYWQLTGHKWFMSAPQSDAFLILAQMSEGLGCFLVPRLREDGSTNGLHFQRLKDKLGNRSNASSEVELDGCQAQLVGLPGRGVQTIIEMVTLTRLDCAVASAGLMRVALWEAVEHCRHRKVLGLTLIDQPLMRRVLADLSLDLAAATLLAFRLAQAFDRAAGDPAEAAYARLMTPIIKYWCCKITPGMITESMECLGGNGYVEEGNLARHYREAPLNAIWEGSGNVMCLDVLRAIGKQPELKDAVLATIAGDLDSGDDAGSNHAQQALQRIEQLVRSAIEDPSLARLLVEQLSALAAVAEMNRLGLQPLANAFANTRLAGRWRSTYAAVDGEWFDETLNLIFP
jgi:putative acyl-CoA dehydrogenase